MHMRPNRLGSERQERALHVEGSPPPLPTHPVNITSHHNDFAPASISLTKRQLAWLDAKGGRGGRSALVRRALDALMALEATEAEQLRALREAKRREVERLQAELRLIDTKLTDFDEDLNRRAAWRDDIRLYLHRAPDAGEDHQKAWARDRAIPWVVYLELREEVTRAPPRPTP